MGKHVKGLAWCLAHSKCSIIVSNYHHDIVDTVIVNSIIISLSLYNSQGGGDIIIPIL